MATFSKESHCTNCTQKLNIFHLLSEQEIEFINSTRYEVSFRKGETIFKQGGPLTHIACLTSGMAKVYLEGNQSNNIILKIVTPSELIGGPGFQVDYRHHFTVTAISDVKACFIQIEAFEQLLAENNQFATEFIKHINQITILLYGKMQNLIQKQMHGRLADTLLYLSKHVYKNNTFTTTLSRQDIADMSAMTKESSIRIMREFKDDGILECEVNDFKILDEDHLLSVSQTG